MNNFKPGGIRHRKDDLGGRPRSDADYGTKGRFDKKPRHDARGGGNRYEDRGQKEMQLFPATCTTCGKSCEVPFRPDGTKPVLCRDCFAKKNSSPYQEHGREERPRFDRNTLTNDNRSERNAAPSRHVAPTIDLSVIIKQIAALEIKVNKILEIIANKPEVSTPVAPVVKVEKKETIKKEKAAPVAAKVPAKKVAAKKVVKKTAKKVSKK